MVLLHEIKEFFNKINQFLHKDPPSPRPFLQKNGNIHIVAILKARMDINKPFYGLEIVSAAMLLNPMGQNIPGMYRPAKVNTPVIIHTRVWQN
jgi:hypothetical protein